MKVVVSRRYAWLQSSSQRSEFTARGAAHFTIVTLFVKLALPGRCNWKARNCNVIV